MVRLPHPLPRTAARLVLGFATALLVVALGASPNAARAETGSGTTRVVSAQGPYTTLAAALVDARPGDTIEVRGGTYPGPLVVEVPRVTLTGVDRPIIDGGGDGTVVTLAAAGRSAGVTIAITYELRVGTSICDRALRTSSNTITGAKSAVDSMKRISVSDSIDRSWPPRRAYQVPCRRRQK